MLKTNNIKEYVSISAFLNYCNSVDDCEVCVVNEICKCMSIEPCKLLVEYVAEVPEDEER